MIFTTELVQKIIEYHDLTTNQIESLTSDSIFVLDIPELAQLKELMVGQKVMIAGDYDFDGITSTVLAVKLCEAWHVEYGYYIPDRIKEGYGTNVNIVTQAYNKGYTRLLMVDNGVKAIEAIQQAKVYDMKLAIIDHHEYDDEPEVDVFIHPKKLDVYFQNMSAGGLLGAILESYGILDDKTLALAAAATIADVMPLTNKNRELVKRGLTILNKKQLPHFDTLVKRTRYTRYTSTLLAFQMVPKVNSIGRLSDRANVNTAVRFFLSDEGDVIKSYSAQIESLNTLRKEMSKSFKLKAMDSITNDPVQIIHDAMFHEGLLGIVANQVMQETSKPSIVLKPYPDIYKGSARSNSIVLTDLLESVNKDYIQAMGGHDFAYGMSIHSPYFEDFKQDINQKALQIPQTITTHLPLEITSDMITAISIGELMELEPFGEGNELPLMSLKETKYKISIMRGYGYKFIFDHPILKEAVYFTSKTLDTNQPYSRFIGTLNVSSPQKVSFFIESVV